EEDARADGGRRGDDGGGMDRVHPLHLAVQLLGNAGAGGVRADRDDGAIDAVPPENLRADRADMHEAGVDGRRIGIVGDDTGDLISALQPKRVDDDLRVAAVADDPDGHHELFLPLPVNFVMETTPFAETPSPFTTFWMVRKNIL